MRKISLARLLAVATPAAALGGMLAMRSPRAGAEGPYDAAPGLAVPAAPDTGPPACAVLQAHLPHADSMEVSVPHARCGALRLVGAGPARLQRTPDGLYTPGRTWEIPVAWENAGEHAVSLPLEMRADSTSPVQRGRQLNEFYARDYAELFLWDRQGMQQPWRFGSRGLPGLRLAPGARTETRIVRLHTTPLAQGFRVAFSVRGAVPPRRPRPAAHLPPDTVPLARDVERFIASMDFPGLRDSRPVFRQPEHGLLIFAVSFGSAQDCLSGCFHSTALGLQLGERIGWIGMDDYDRTPGLEKRVRRRWFTPRPGDRPLFSAALHETLAARFGRDAGVATRMLLLATGAPDAPRELLLQLAERLYARVDQPLATWLSRAPAVQSDVGLLTLLGGLPNGGPPYAEAREHARQALRRLAPGVVRDPRASPRTLFLLAQQLQGVAPDEEALATALAGHPNARANPAILAVLAENRPQLRAQVMASVRAPERVKGMLAEYLEGGAGEGAGARLLRDPEAGRNADVLAVLANQSLGMDQETVWAASRRLPESALLRWEPAYVPLR